MTHVYL